MTVQNVKEVFEMANYAAEKITKELFREASSVEKLTVEGDSFIIEIDNGSDFVYQDFPIDLILAVYIDIAISEFIEAYKEEKRLEAIAYKKIAEELSEKRRIELEDGERKQYERLKAKYEAS